MKRLAVTLGLVSIVFAAASCSVDGPNELGYVCATDEECETGEVCIKPDGEDQPGYCDVEGIQCFDRDGDGFFAVGCANVEAEQWDCNDQEPGINPGEEERCDGVDNNCNCDGDSNGDDIACGPGDDGVDEDTTTAFCARQVGVCAGATIACTAGGYPITECADLGAYPDTYEFDETLCDELDNDCDGFVDENCDCAGDVDQAVECEGSVDTGPCTRGIRVCENESSRSECMEAALGRVCAGTTNACAGDADCPGSTCERQTCEADADCTAAPNGYCVSETYRPEEDPFDSCTTEPDAECAFRVCRYLNGETPCEDDSACDAEAGEFCFNGTCQGPNVERLATELCNGIDDNCNGRIDDPGPSASGFCGNCPYNMIFANNAAGGDPFFCIDRYEASRPDATAESAGDFSFYSASEAGVQPWTGINAEDANTACQGQLMQELYGVQTRVVPGKFLCSSINWHQGCGGPAATAEEVEYPYTTDANDDGIIQPEEDVYVSGACVDSSRGETAPAITGGAPQCCREINPGAAPGETTCDMVGNVSEWVFDASNRGRLAGGSYQDDDGAILSCGDGVNYQLAPDVEDFSDIDSIGFRCCTLRLSQ